MAGVSNWFSQVVSVTRLSLQTIVERKGPAAAATFGIAGVVAVFVAVLSIAQGFLRVMEVSGDPDAAIVMRTGADTEMMSIVMGPDRRLIGDAPGVGRSDRGALTSS